MFDKIIIGAGLYGLYAALYCARKGQRLAVLETEPAPFTRATYINQARVHMGYHYPRSISTAMKSAGYFKRFVEDYDFCIHSEFEQVYATSSHFSWTDAREFRKFCKDARIPCTPLPAERYFREGVCDGAFLTKEYTYDARLLRDYFVEELGKYPNVSVFYNREINRIVKGSRSYEIFVQAGEKDRAGGKAASEGDSPGQRLEAPFVLNAAYASVNQVLERIEGAAPEAFQLKYELCEIILCRASELLKDVGLTVMDGPFFSIMPFGKTGYHSLTSVTFTPHKTCYERTPAFSCEKGGDCKKGRLGNCDGCVNRPESAWEYMSALARKYMREEYGFAYEKSLFSMKPVLKASEIDDSRPTVIKYVSRKPYFVSVLSGKINTVYDLDECLEEE